MQKVSVFWFRRDLRLDDNAGLYHALKSGHKVLPIFIFDTEILNELEDRYDKRVSFIYNQLQNIQSKLVAMGSTLHVINSNVIDAYKQLTQQYHVTAVYTNTDYEPYAIKRDQEVQAFLNQKGIDLYSYKDQVIFHQNEVVKDDGSPYVVYTPYSKRWKQKLNSFYIKPYPTEKYFSQFYQQEEIEIPTLESIGFKLTAYHVVDTDVEKNLISNYTQTRDIPSIKGTSKLSVHLRFGTVSIRKLVAQTKDWSEKYLNELIWREFYQMILWHYPNNVHRSFRIEYDDIKWRNNEEEFQKWCDGQTGYPIVDAGMRELNETGYMHNRVRMIVASFLTKHLLIDWRWGEAYFAKKLLDFDLASNNGGWQWAAGCGCDAAPYFRVFNPYLQTKKFDQELKYIRQWVSELDELTYPTPIVDHDAARKRCLEVYKDALQKDGKI